MIYNREDCRTDVSRAGKVSAGRVISRQRDDRA